MSELRKIFPDGRFSPAASEEDIASVEAELGMPLPAELRAMYLECDGFREPKGNAKYLLSLREKDFIGSMMDMTRYFWTEFDGIDFSEFIFFGSSVADELWAVRASRPYDVIAYHHSMEGSYEARPRTILETFKADFRIYDQLEDET